MVIDAGDNILQISLARRGQDHFGYALSLQVPGETLLIPPHPGVVHHQTIVDTVGGIVHVLGLVRVNHFHFIAVGDE